ncbi:Endonuclease/exonuclease/phosphatase, partial [Mycena belliarum]
MRARGGRGGTPSPAQLTGGASPPRAARARPVPPQATLSERQSVPPGQSHPEEVQQHRSPERNAPLQSRRARRQSGIPTDEEHAPAFFARKRELQQRNNPPISRKTRAQIKISALNINGRKKDSIHHPDHKWHGLSRLMYDEKIGILVVGETHLSTEQALEIQDHHQLGRRMDIYHSPNPENTSTRGIAIVLNREITNTKGVEVHYLVPGRAILAKVPWHGRRVLTILGVYAPAESMEENKEFWDHLTNLWLTTDLPVPDAFQGDTNIVEEPIDRFPHRRDSEAATAALARFKRLLGLQDGWRAENPDTKEYTYASARDTLSRIDRIYAAPNLMKYCRKWEISDAAGGLTDHRLVSVVISAPGSPYLGKGRYQIPLFILRDKEFIDFTVKLGQSLEAEIDAAPDDAITIQTGWKTFKEKVRNFARERAKIAVGALEQKKRKLQEEREIILNAPAPAPVPVEPEPPPTTVPTEDSPAAKAATIQRAIDSIVERQREQKRTDTRIRCHTELDRITKFSVRMSKDATPRDTISYLQRTDIAPAKGSRRSDEMAEIARDYHADLQMDESEEDPVRKGNTIAAVLEGMSAHQNNPAMACLATLLSEDNVLEALLQSTSGTAAGIDGIPTELWKKLNEIFNETQRS